MTVDIRAGDALTVLKTMPACSVQVCVTSPPYFGLRDYGVSGQLGLEKTPQLYVGAMVQVFSEVKRVLRGDGTLWLNIGDSYAARGNSGGNGGITNIQASSIREKGWRGPPKGMKNKDRIGVPWMLAFALRSDGWYLRDEIIWHKPNPMPSSVTDRTTTAHEQIFLLSKKARYYYDAAAIATPVKAPTTKMPDGWDTGPGAHGTIHRNGREKGKKVLPETQAKLGKLRDNERQQRLPRTVANARSVWTITTNAYPEAHFATFPPELAERCILAGSAKGQMVLDPFGGAGTTGLVADRLGRDAILIELNPKYAEMARKRIREDAPLFHDPEGSAA